MTEKEKLEAKAIKRILDIETKELVGWLYEWNTGERDHRWIKAPVEDYIYEDLLVSNKSAE